MNEEMMKAFTDAMEALRADVTAHVGKLGADVTALADSVAKMKADADEENENDQAQRVAADRRARSDSVDPAAFAALSASVAEMRKRQSRPTADLNAFADVQAKADAVLRTHNERADAPMHGEDLVAFKIRSHRPLQRHSAKWKGVELSLIAADHRALDNVLTEIRADALQAGLNPVGLPEFQHREIVQQTPGGHTIRSWVGNGTIFKQLSRPVRHVAFIGTRSSAHH
jgi:hypothetical protein